MTDHPTRESLFEAGLPVRRAVLGAEYVDPPAWRRANDFMLTFQHATTELAWGLRLDPPRPRSGGPAACSTSPC